MRQRPPLERSKLLLGDVNPVVVRIISIRAHRHTVGSLHYWRLVDKRIRRRRSRPRASRSTPLIAVRAVGRRLRFVSTLSPCLETPSSFVGQVKGKGASYRRHALLPAPLAAVDVVLHTFAELFEEEGALEAHFHYCAVEAEAARTGFLVGGLDFVEAAFELDAFAVVGFFCAGGERCVGCGRGWA